MMNEQQVFTGLRVLDLSRWVAGEFATKLFADFGADVIKVEKPGEGSLTRNWGPFPGDVHNPECSALFLHLNTNKRSIALDLRTEIDTLLELVERADAVVESFRPGHLERLGLAPEVLLARNPRLVITRISAFGQDGPYRDYEATGLVLQAMGGPMNATGAADRPPLRKPGLLEQYTIGRTAAEATLAGLVHARRTGAGAVIDVSGQEVLLSSADRRASYLMAAAYSGTDAPRGTRSAHRGRTMFTGPFRAKDGYVMVYVTNQEFWNRFVNLAGAHAPEFRAQFLDRTDVTADRDQFLSFVRDWFEQRPKLEIMEQGEGARIPLTAVLELDELLDHPHFRERGVYVRADHPVAGSLEYLGAPWRMRNGFRLVNTAPMLGQHDQAIRTELTAPRILRPANRPPSTEVTVGPLDRVRVVDLTVVWAGPGATALLGDLGAEVIRIEGNNRISRQVSSKITKERAAGMGYHAATYPGRDPGPRPYDRSALFNWHSRNKLAACMNLETPEGRQAALDLIAVSDVLVENNSNGTLEKLGLDPEKLLRLNPRLIVARMPPMGMSGPMSDYLGYGPNFNSLIGIAAMDGYRGETPDTAGENYHMDEASPAGMAFAVLAALWDRERTGVGGVIEFAQAEHVMHDIGEFILDRQLNGRNPAVMGNGDPHLLQDVFPAAEPDRWVAISLRGEADRIALARVMAAPLEEAGEGRAGEDELYAAIARWSSTMPAEEIVAALQAQRVPAGEVMSETRVLGDPHLAARGWFRTRSHPATGSHRYPGQPWKVTGFPLAFGRPLPGFGEDNEYVYRGILGYSEQRYADLRQRELVTDEQIA